MLGIARNGVEAEGPFDPEAADQVVVGRNVGAEQGLHAPIQALDQGLVSGGAAPAGDLADNVSDRLERLLHGSSKVAWPLFERLRVLAGVLAAYNLASVPLAGSASSSTSQPEAGEHSPGARRSPR